MLFTQAEKAALDYATELTRSEAVSPETFARLRKFYSEREICDIVWLIARERISNVTDRGLGIGSDVLCELSAQRTRKRLKPSRRGEQPSSTASR